MTSPEDLLKGQVTQLIQQNQALEAQLTQLQACNGVGGGPSVHRLSPKLPPFWPDHPDVWFAQVEAQFKIAGITADETKYGYVAGHLDSRWAQEVRDILVNPPVNERYEYLKTELIRRLSESAEKRVRKLINEEVLGDRTPSQFLRHLRSLSDESKVPEDLLRSLWLQRLPLTIQAMLQLQKDLPLNNLATLADSISELTPPTFAPAVHAAAATSSTEVKVATHPVAASAPSAVDFSEFREQLKELKVQVAALTERSRASRSRTHSRSRKIRDLTPSAASSTRSSDVCWYHRKFQEKARHCEAPCSYQTENSKGSRQ